MEKINEIIEFSQANSLLVLTDPHSATEDDIPEDFSLEHRLFLDKGYARKTINSGIDYCVPMVTGFHDYVHASKVSTLYPRVYLDVNRGITDVDCYSVENGGKETKPHGLLWRASMEKFEDEIRDIRGMVSQSEFSEMLNIAYFPFVNTTRNLLNAAKDEHGIAILWDLHSMPPNKFSYVGNGKYKNAYLGGEEVGIGSIENGKMPEFILMASKESCDTSIYNYVFETFKRHGFTIEVRARVASKAYSCSSSLYNLGEGYNVLAIETVGHHGLEPGRTQGRLIFDPEPGIVDKCNNVFYECYEGLRNLKFMK